MRLRLNQNSAAPFCLRFTVPLHTVECNVQHCILFTICNQISKLLTSSVQCALLNLEASSSVACCSIKAWRSMKIFGMAAASPVQLRPQPRHSYPPQSNCSTVSRAEGNRYITRANTARGSYRE
jgi:hypothetical protein